MSDLNLVEDIRNGIVKIGDIIHWTPVWDRNSNFIAEVLEVDYEDDEAFVRYLDTGTEHWWNVYTNKVSLDKEEV